MGNNKHTTGNERTAGLPLITGNPSLPIAIVGAFQVGSRECGWIQWSITRLQQCPHISGCFHPLGLAPKDRG